LLTYLSPNIFLPLLPFTSFFYASPSLMPSLLESSLEFQGVLFSLAKYLEFGIAGRIVRGGWHGIIFG